MDMAERERRNRVTCVRFASTLLWASFAAARVQAAEPDTSGWTCELCAPSAGWEMDVEAGPGYVSDADFRFGDYTGLDDDGFYLFGDAFARYWGDDAHYMRLDSYRLGQESRALFLEGGRLSSYQLRASYQGIPRRIFDTTSTPYRGNGSDRLTLPADWVRAPSTQQMTQLDNSLQQVDIKRKWNVYTAGATFTPVSHWAFDVDYRRQDRDGRNIYAGSFFFNAAEFVAPVDDDTDELTASVAYNADRWQLKLSYIGSFYDNNNSSLTWDNAYSPQVPGADTGQMALAPDNRANQLALAGSMLLPVNTTLSGQLSLGRMKQDDRLLPYTTNAQISTSALPRSRADGKVDTSNVDLRVTSTPVTDFTVEGEFRYNGRDNDTPQDVYDYVVTDLFVSPDPAENIAYDFRRYDYKLNGEYRFMPQARLHAGVDYQRYYRSQQERKHTNTTRLWTRVKARPGRLADVDVELYTEKRGGSSYEPITDVPDPQNPLMRKYNMADRKRNGMRAYAAAYATERANAGFEAEYNKDDYDKSEIGLEDGKYVRLGLDGSYLVTRDVTAYGSVSWEKIKSKQANSQTFSDPDWFAKNDDKFYTATVGLRYPKIIGKLGADVEYTYARSNGKTENSTSGLQSDFPTLHTTLNQLKLGLDYPYSDELSLKFGYLYEKYDADDWALEGVDPATLPNLLSLGADPYHYSTQVFFIGVRYILDSRGRVKPGLPLSAPESGS
jgi:MtrB/PioB family decaheme-associated outer membrane protein